MANFWKNLFAKASEISRLTDERNYLESCLAREIDRNKLLEKSIVSERNSKDKFMALMADRLSIQAKLPSGFAKSIEPEKKKEEFHRLSEEDEAKVEWIVAQQKQYDVDKGFDVQPDEYYEKIVRSDLSRYLPT